MTRGGESLKMYSLTIVFWESMKSIIKIGKSGLAYIPEKMREEGYKGDIECLPNAITFTLIRPGSSMADVKRSLENVIKDIELRIKYHREEANEDRNESNTTAKPAPDEGAGRQLAKAHGGSRKDTDSGS